MPPAPGGAATPAVGTGVPDTGLRFVLLMTLVTGASVGMLDMTLAPRPNDSPGDPLGCLLAAGLDPDGTNLNNLLAEGHSQQPLDRCLAAVPAIANWKGLAATAVLLAVAALAYWWLPRRRDRRRRTVALETVDPSGVLAAELTGLAAVAGTGSSRVRFRVDPGRTTAGAVVYGRTGRYTVCLHAGLLTLRTTDPERFRAVVLHELAHVRNRDVDFAYSSTVLWRTFVVLALLPYLFGAGRLLYDGVAGNDTSPFWPGTASMITYSVLSGLLLVLLVHLTRADLLRRRELYADARAVAWGASPAAWDRPGPVAARWRRTTALLRTHPGWGERRQALADPGRLSRTDGLPMLLLGVAGSLLVHELAALPGLSGGSRTVWLAAAFVAPVLCWTVRRSVLRGPGGATGVGAGLWLGLGLLVGEFVGGGNSGTDWVVGRPGYLSAFLFIGTVPAVWWAQSTRLTEEIPLARVRWAATLFNGLVTLVLLWGGLRWWQLGGRFEAVGLSEWGGATREMMRESFPGPWQNYSGELSATTHSLSVLTDLNNQALLGCAAAAMALVPLVLHLLAGRTGLRVRGTLLAGAAGGLLCWLAIVAESYALHRGRPATLHERFGAFQYVQTWWLVVTVTGACVLTAAVVAGVSRRYWMLRALLAAQVTQVIGYAGVFLLGAADGSFGPLNVIGSSPHWIPGNGRLLTQMLGWQSVTSSILFAACAGLAAAGAGRLVRRLRGARHADVMPETVPEHAPAPARFRGVAVLRQGTALALAVPALLLVALAYGHPVAHAKSPSAPDRFPELIDAPPAARKAKMRAWQTVAWLEKGGLTRSKGLADAETAIGAGLGQAAGQQPGADGKVTLDEGQFTRLCGALDQQVQQARQYFPVPDPKLQREWADALNRIGGDAQNCLVAMGGSGKGASGRTSAPTGAEKNRLFENFLTDLPKAMQALENVLTDIKAQTELPD